MSDGKLGTQADRIQGPCFMPLVFHSILEAPEDVCLQTLPFFLESSLFSPWVWGGGGVGTAGGETGSRLGGNSWRTTSPPVAADLEVWVESPPEGTTAKLPPTARGKPPGDCKAEGIQGNLPRTRCVHSWPDGRLPPPPPFRGRLTPGILQNKAALFSPPGSPGLLGGPLGEGGRSESSSWQSWEFAVGSKGRRLLPSFFLCTRDPITLRAAPNAKTPPQTLAPPGRVSLDAEGIGIQALDNFVGRGLSPSAL